MCVCVCVCSGSFRLNYRYRSRILLFNAIPRIPEFIISLGWVYFMSSPGTTFFELVPPMYVLKESIVSTFEDGS
jgi:hypothetical protein